MRSFYKKARWGLQPGELLSLTDQEGVVQQVRLFPGRKAWVLILITITTLLLVTAVKVMAKGYIETNSSGKVILMGKGFTLR